MSRPLISRLHDMGACGMAIEWVMAQDVDTPQKLWNIAPPAYMLWLLRRTMFSYKSQKIRTLARCLVDIIDTCDDEDKDYQPKVVRARDILLAFAEGRAETEDIYALHLSLDWESGRFFRAMESLSKAETEIRVLYRNPFKLSPAELAADTLILPSVYGPCEDIAQEIVLRYFPKPPRF